MKIRELLCFFLIISTNCEAQEEFLPFQITDSTYENIKKANTLFSSGNYHESVFEFENSLSLLDLFPMERYKFALALWMIDDSLHARINFEKALKNGLKFPSLTYFKQSPYVKELSFNDDVFQKALNTTKMDSLAIYKKERIDLIQLKIDDQKYRVGENVDDSTFRKQDSLNRIVLKGIIDQIGWPGFLEVGYDGENSTFLVAQHSDNDLIFQKQCLDWMKIGFDTKNITISNYALIIDRYLINTGRMQLFGTQVYFDPELKKTIQKECYYTSEINSLRKLYQLNSLEDYLKIFN